MPATWPTRSAKLAVGEINVRYAHAGRTYHQVLKVHFEVRDAQPGTPCD
ncbi:MAG TPA: hypothetical protein VK659_09950 [Asanoa sp.]|nr:hypothetical protein [Asanoa sp.]